MITEVQFNGIELWKKYGIAVASPVDFPIPSEIKEIVHIRGANGSYTEAMGYYSDLEIKVSFRALNYKEKHGTYWELKSKINQLFNNVIDNRLIFSEYPSRYYKVKSVNVGAVTRVSEYEADFEAEFLCEPFLYNPNEEEVNSAGTIKYNGDIPNKPIIAFICGSSAQVTVECNGVTLTFMGRQGKKVEINANPYATVVVDGVTTPSIGDAPIFKKGNNYLSISGVGYNSLIIIKNERYLG